MSQEDSGVHVNTAPEVQVHAGRSFSIIWVVPIIAVLIGGWLAYKAKSEKGPVITIAFASADGLVAGKTTIKFKDVEIGKVSEIELKEDLSGVIVTAEMNRDSDAFMTDKTDFWVVRARVAAGEVSGLGTLFSGAYIGCNPSAEGLAIRHFEGLEKTPILTEGQPGSHFILKSKSLGSLDIGAPVYYRGIKVGQVVQYDFDETAEFILLKVFINAPYHEKVRENSRFWNASGVDFSMSASGIKMDTQSLVSIMLGGVAFDLPIHALPQKQAETEKSFLLYSNQEDSKEENYDIKKYYMMYFDESVRGLSPGAPVEIQGIKIGEVISVDLLFDMKAIEFRIPVVVMIEPERMNALVTVEGALVTGEQKDQEIAEDSHSKLAMMRPDLLIDKGLRAQLKTGNLLTGQMYIDLDFHPDAPPTDLKEVNGLEVFPTIPVPFERIMHRVENILKQVEQIQFGKISKDVEVAVVDLQTLLKDFKSVSGKINTETIPKINNETIPKINASLDELNTTLQGIDKTLGPDSPLSYNSRKITDELSMTIRSLRSMLEYLERDPQALILGKQGDKK